MAYRVTHHNQELIIEKDYRYSAFMPGVFGVFLLFFSLLTQAQANMPEHPAPALLHGIALLLALAGVFLMITGTFFYFRTGRVIIDFEQDTVTVHPLLRRSKTIPFKEIDGLTVRKTPVPDGDGVNQWELFLRTDQGRVPLIDLYNELEVKRFLLEMQQGADWPVEHVNVGLDSANKG